MSDWVLGVILVLVLLQLTLLAGATSRAANALEKLVQHWEDNVLADEEKSA